MVWVGYNGYPHKRVAGEGSLFGAVADGKRMSLLSVLMYHYLTHGVRRRPRLASLPDCLCSLICHHEYLPFPHIRRS